MIKNLSIKQKMLIVSFFILVIVIILVVYFYITLSNVTRYTNIAINIEKLNSNVLELRRNEKDFLLRKNMKYVNKFKKNYSTNLNYSKELEVMINDLQIDTTNLTNYKSIIQQYNDYFITIVKYKEFIGLNEKLGLYGKMRANIHKLQTYTKDNKKYRILSLIYELRKHEKDFMLRKNIKYVDSFEKLFEETFLIIKDKELKKYLLLYKNNFLNIIKEEIYIGLKENQGLMALMRNTVHKTSDIFTLLSQSISKIRNDNMYNIVNLTIIISIISILLIIFLIYLIYTDIVFSIKKIKNSINNYFEYLNGTKQSIDIIEVTNVDEFGDIINLINNNINITTKFLIDQHKDIEKTSYYDNLTGVYNRKILYELFNYEVKDIKKHDDTFSILIMDIDNLKKINEDYGYDIGDLLLIEFVKIAKKHIRKLDILVRWAGNEFVILLPKTNFKSSLIIANELRIETNNYYNNTSKIKSNVTISIGLSEYKDKDTLDTLIKRSILALKEAKNNGKNQVIIK